MESRETLVTLLSKMKKSQAKLDELIFKNTPPVCEPNLHLCIAQEASEGIDHLGYKHWKKTKEDIAQYNLEVVDIIHFFVSILNTLPDDEREALESNFLIGYKSSQESSVVKTKEVKIAVLHKLRVESLSYDSEITMTNQLKASLKRDNSMLGINIGFLLGISMTFSEMFELYLGKNTLNIFRQNNGYHLGTYKKIFSDGREDNEHLFEVINELKASGSELDLDLVYKKIEERY